jgi:hypothetical protein
LNVRDTLYAIADAGLTLKASMTKDTLKVFPVENLIPELVAAIKEHKAEFIKIMREDEQIRRTGIIWCKSQVFELAREYFGMDDQEAQDDHKAQQQNSTRCVSRVSA